MPTLKALLKFDEVEPQIFSYVDVHVPLNTEPLHEILYEYLGAFGNLDDDFVGCDMGGWTRIDAAHGAEILEEAMEYECLEGWQRIRDIFNTAVEDGINIVILFWEHPISLPDKEVE